MSGYLQEIKKITTHKVQELKNSGTKITMLTAYDYSMAKIIDKSGIDIILVGDSAANVMAGFNSTLPITLNEMIFYASNVVRGVSRALVVVDLPFGTFQSNSKLALASAIRIMKETGAGAVKLEGGAETKESIQRILDAGIPVMGHLGLIPQSIHKFGTYVVRAKEEAEAEKLINDANLLQELGCFSIVLEKVPAKLATKISKSLIIPVIGIGAGNVDGQVLVSYDMLGLTQEFSPRFLRRYADLDSVISEAVKKYISDIKKEDFPNEKEQY